ncbi:MAG: protein translocase subunit SecD [Chitinophagaceae bacterium]|nr:protein translocase subunit SecD [Anaerolineae bacterium]
MRRNLLWLVFIVVLTTFSVYIALPDTPKPDFLKRGGNEERLLECQEQAAADPTATVDCSRFEPELEFSQGLDLVGGLRVLLQAEVPTDTFTRADLQETANSVGRRVNSLGLSEATVILQGDSRILVELPGVTDPQQAIDTIQQTALLEFVDFGGLGTQAQSLVGRSILTDQQEESQAQREAAAAQQGSQNPEATAEPTVSQVEAPLVNPNTGLPFDTIMTGAGLEAAVAEFTGQQWVINFELNSEGSAVFGPFTAQRIGEPLAIVLDGIVLSAPRINAQLDTGGVIEGQFTEQEAKQLALQLRAGSLPIPLRVESAESVGATLGQESVELSVRAGVVGIIVVLAFMLIYYRVPGIAADLALLVFIALNVALFKLIPVTLTLPSIVGFLISIGTAVDGNILIFERIKEEIRGGTQLDAALIAGFDRAWTSIRDSNLSTIIICGVLFLFGQTPGASIVSGFAVTLALGLIVNLFTAVLVTRTFLYLLVAILRRPLTERSWLLGVSQGA